jgi:microsomal dipeptidase-like Zn-dependent dipeptidase
LAAEVDRRVIISHAGVKKWHDHEYNLDEEEIRRLHEQGGVMG